MMTADLEVILDSYLDTIDDVPADIASNLTALRELDQIYQSHLQNLRFARQQYYERSFSKPLDDDSVKQAMEEYLHRYNQASTTVEEKVTESQRILENFQTHIARLEREALKFKKEYSDKANLLLETSLNVNIRQQTTSSASSHTRAINTLPQTPLSQSASTISDIVPVLPQTTSSQNVLTLSRAQSEESEYLWPENNPSYHPPLNTPPPTRNAALVASTILKETSNAVLMSPVTSPPASDDTVVVPSPASTVKYAPENEVDQSSLEKISNKRKKEEDVSLTNKHSIIIPILKKVTLDPDSVLEAAQQSPASSIASQKSEEDNKLYCTCQQMSYGDMIACDNHDCEIEWFHWDCVGLTSSPKGSWFCPICSGRGPVDDEKTDESVNNNVIFTPTSYSGSSVSRRSRGQR